MACGIVALRDEDVVIGARISRLVDGNRFALFGTTKSVTRRSNRHLGSTYHKLFFDFAKTVQAWLQLKMMIGSGLGDC